MAPVCKVAARRFRSMLHTCFRAQLSAKIRRRKGIFASIIYVKIMQHLRSDTWALVQFEQPHQLVEAGKLQQPTRATERAGKPEASLSSSSTSLVYAIPRSIRIAAKYEVEVLRFTIGASREREGACCFLSHIGNAGAGESSTGLDPN